MEGIDFKRAEPWDKRAWTIAIVSFCVAGGITGLTSYGPVASAIDVVLPLKLGGYDSAFDINQTVVLVYIGIIPIWLSIVAHRMPAIWAAVPVIALSIAGMFVQVAMREYASLRSDFDAGDIAAMTVFLVVPTSVGLGIRALIARKRIRKSQSATPVSEADPTVWPPPPTDLT
jgi:hypothetical protein